MKPKIQNIDSEGQDLKLKIRVPSLNSLSSWIKDPKVKSEV